MASTDGFDKNSDIKTDDKGQETFSEKMKKRQKKKKQREKEASNPYNLLKYYGVILFIPIFLILLDSYTILMENHEFAENINKYAFYIYGTIIYIFLFPLSVIQELLGFIHIDIPLNYLLNIEPDTFTNYNFLTINYNDFTYNIHELLNSKYVFYQNQQAHDQTVDANVLFMIYVMKVLSILYVIGYFIFFLSSKYISTLLGISVNEYEKIYEDFKKAAYGNPKTMEEVEKLNKNKSVLQKKLLTTEGKRIDYLTIFKDSFEARNAMFCAIFGGKLYKDNSKKYELFKHINEIFDSYIVNDYYNIINFMTAVDKKLLNVETIPNKDTKDTFKQKEYTAKAMENFLNLFDDETKIFIVPTFVTTLRKYRTFDIHNLIYLLLKHPTIAQLTDEMIKIEKDGSGSEDDKKNMEKINRVKRVAKDAYKAYAKKIPETQDGLGISIQVRYPLSFSNHDIKRIEKMRELIKLEADDMRLKFLGSDENMKIFNIEESAVNETAKQYYDNEFSIYIEKIVHYMDEFIKVAELHYSWLKNKEGKKIQILLKKNNLFKFQY